MNSSFAKHPERVGQGHIDQGFVEQAKSCFIQPVVYIYNLEASSNVTSSDGRQEQRRRLCLPPGVLAGPEVSLHPRDEEHLAVVDVDVHQGQRLPSVVVVAQINKSQLI